MISNNDIYGTVKSISNFVETQFPAFYRENSATFIAFVKAYYEWLESPENPLYLTRRLYEIKDVDDTLDEFIVQFKEKYLKGIQFDTAANIRMIIKHAL